MSDARRHAPAPAAFGSSRVTVIMVAAVLLAPLLLLVAFATDAVAGPAAMIAVMRTSLVIVALALASASTVVRLLDLLTSRGRGAPPASSWLLLGLSALTLALPLALLAPTIAAVGVTLFSVASAWVVGGTIAGVIRLGPRALLPAAAGFALLVPAVVVTAIAAITEGADDASFVLMLSSSVTISAALLLLLWRANWRGTTAFASGVDPADARRA